MQPGNKANIKVEENIAINLILINISSINPHSFITSVYLRMQSIKHAERSIEIIVRHVLRISSNNLIIIIIIIFAIRATRVKYKYEGICLI